MKVKVSITCLLLFILSEKIVRGQKEVEVDDIEDYDDYEEEEIYHEETGPLPKFLPDQSKDLFFKTGSTIELQCKVDSIGSYFVLWTKFPNQMLVLPGNVVMPSEKSRGSVKADDSGSKFIRKNATKEDSGKYFCSLNHPNTTKIFFDIKVDDVDPTPTTTQPPIVESNKSSSLITNGYVTLLSIFTSTIIMTLYHYLV